MWRRFIYWALTIAFAFFVVTRLSEIGYILKTLSEGIWWWVIAAVTIQIANHLIHVYLYQKTLTFLSVKNRFIDLVPVFYASYFVNIAAPVGGVGPAVLFADNASRRRQSSA